MTSRPRTRWLFERLAFLLLCICVATGYELGRALWHSQPAPLRPQATGTCLDRPVTLKVVDMPLEQVVGELSRQTGQPIVADWGRIGRDWGDVRRAPVTADLDDVTLESALQTVFGDAAPRVPVRDVLGGQLITVAVALQAPLRYGVSHGIVTVSTGPQAWDVVVGTYDVGDLVDRFSDHPDGNPQPPVFVLRRLPGGGGGSTASGGLLGSGLPPYTAGGLGRPFPALSPRGVALDDLMALVRKVLRENPVEGTTPPTVTQWGDRLIVVATEAQQHDLQEFLACLRAKIAPTANATPLR